MGNCFGKILCAYATNNLTRFGAAPMEGHMKRAVRIFGYLRYNDRGRTIFEILYPDIIKVESKHDYCICLYPDAEESIPSNALIRVI